MALEQAALALALLLLLVRSGKVSSCSSRALAAVVWQHGSRQR
jgi:hypothetical protein